MNIYRYNSFMKESNRKLGNLIIRNHSKKSSREEANKTKTTQLTDVDKKRATCPKFDNNL